MMGSAIHLLIFLIGGAEVRFVQDPARHLMLDEKCARTAGCLALIAFTKAGESGLKPSAVAPEKVGARLCTETFGGKVILGHGSAGGQNGFCAFTDGSLVDLGSLAYAFREKKNSR